LVCLCLCLAGLVKTLRSMIQNTSETMMKKATNLNGYVAMLVGCGLTILVQSSSITTSVLTPLVGLNIISLENMFPLTLGANIGTTCTALLASMVGDSPQAVQIALCHLFFNLFGIAIWYPVPIMRRVPLRLARSLGAITSRYRFFPVIYIAFCFAVAPLALIGISSLFTMGLAYKVIGVCLVVSLIVSLLFFLVWFYRKGGREYLVSLVESRQIRSDVMSKLPDTITDLKAELAELKKTVHDLSRDNTKNSGMTPSNKESAAAASYQNKEDVEAANDQIKEDVEA